MSWTYAPGDPTTAMGVERPALDRLFQHGADRRRVIGDRAVARDGDPDRRGLELAYPGEDERQLVCRDVCPRVVVALCLKQLPHFEPAAPQLDDPGSSLGCLR
jgi:hypothetical protein